MYSAKAPGPPRIERLHVRNFRALRDVDFKDVKPLTALLGPNGSGKSTVFDVFAFLADCSTPACGVPGTGVAAPENSNHETRMDR